MRRQAAVGKAMSAMSCTHASRCRTSFLPMYTHTHTGMPSPLLPPNIFNRDLVHARRHSDAGSRACVCVSPTCPCRASPGKATSAGTTVTSSAAGRQGPCVRRWAMSALLRTATCCCSWSSSTLCSSLSLILLLLLLWRQQPCNVQARWRLLQPTWLHWLPLSRTRQLRRLLPAVLRLGPGPWLVLGRLPTRQPPGKRTHPGTPPPPRRRRMRPCCCPSAEPEPAWLGARGSSGHGRRPSVQAPPSRSLPSRGARGAGCQPSWCTPSSRARPSR